MGALINRLLVSVGIDDRALKKGSKRVNKNINGLARNINKVGAGIALVGAGLAAGAFASAITTINEFDQGVANLAATSGKTKTEINGLVANAKAVGAVSAFSATEVLALQTELAKLGNNEGQIISMTKAVGDFSIAVGATAAEAATLTGGALKSFGKNANDTTALVNTLAVATTKSALDFNKLNVALPIVGTAADQSGISLERTTALLGVLSDRNIDASTSGTALRNIFLELKNKGISYEQAMAQINGSTDKLNTANQLFGKRGAVVATVLAESGEAADSLEASITGVSGALDKMTKERLNTAKGQSILFKSAFEGLVLSIDSGQGILSDTSKAFYELSTSILTAATSANDGTGTWTSFFQSIIDPSYREKIKLGKSALDKYISSVKSLSEDQVVAKSGKIIGALSGLYAASGSTAEAASKQAKGFYDTLVAGFQVVEDNEKSASNFPPKSLGGGGVVEEVKTFATEVSRLEDEIQSLSEAYIAGGSTDQGILSNLKQKATELGDLNNKLKETEGLVSNAFGRGVTAPQALSSGGDQSGLLTGDRTSGPSVESGAENVQLSDDFLARAKEGTTSLTRANEGLRDSYAALGNAMGASLAQGGSSLSDFASKAAKSAQSFISNKIKEYVAQQLLNSAIASGPFGLFLAPVIAGAAAGLFNTAINSLNPPKLAEGGVVSGPRIVQVGEYAGASTNPEIIAPERKLTNIFSSVLARHGGGGGELHGQLKGSDVLLSTKREQSVRKRTAFT